MKKNFYHFFKLKISNFFQAIFNLFIFFPYYFSVSQLLKTLFKPWKNLVFQKKSPGFSLNEWLEITAGNLISCGIGFSMRILLIFIFILIQLMFVILLPILILIYFCYLPLSYLVDLLEKPEEEKKNLLKQTFIKTHLLKTENLSKVEKWFEEYYLTQIKKTSWWQKENLFSIPPLARDWSVGYTPILDQFAKELTKETPHFRTLVNREKEIRQIELILSKSEGADVIIVGEEGVGKHTIVEALAKRIYQGKTSPILAYKRVLKLDMERIISQTTDFSQKEEILKKLFQEAADAKNIIIVIDDFDRYIASGFDRIDLTVPIAEFAKTNKLQIIGITTPFLYQKFIFPNEKIHRLFEKVEVFEIKEEEAEEILLQIAFEFESRFGVIIPYETVKEIIEKSNFYITDIPFPEKAIDILDETCVYANQAKIKRITPGLVDEILSQKTHIPVNLDQSLKNKLLHLEEMLEDQIVFQKEGIKKLSSTLRKSFIVARKRKKPLASFLFLGPTGVGKTETAKALAKVFFGSEENLLRFDMSFYQRKEDIPNLLGSFETNQPGLLTKAIREKPYGVLLLDEIEKGNKDLLNIFLTLLDEGYITDGFGKKVDCKSLIVIATSNAGADIIFKKGISSSQANLSSTELINYLVQNKIFTPEFLNRFDGVIVYQPLTKEAVYEIAKKMLSKIIIETERLHHIKIKISEDFINQIVKKGYHPQFGARNLERVIRDELEDKIAKLILEKNL